MCYRNISVPTEKGATMAKKVDIMDVRSAIKRGELKVSMVQGILLLEDIRSGERVTLGEEIVPCIQYLDADPAEVVADYLLDNGVTITLEAPGPADDNPNIMELCFRNGERNMKEKVITMLQDILDQEGGLCRIYLSEVIKAVEVL